MTRPTASLVVAARRRLITAKSRVTRLENRRRYLEGRTAVSRLHAIDKLIAAARAERDQIEKHWRELHAQLLAPEVRAPMVELAASLATD